MPGTVWPVVPVEFVAELGIWGLSDVALADLQAFDDRLNTLIRELRQHFLIEGIPGVTVQDKFPRVRVVVGPSVDGVTGTVQSGAAAVFFENISIEDALEHAKTFKPKADFIKNLSFSPITRESEAARRKERAELKKAAAEFIAARKDGARKDKELRDKSRELGGGDLDTINELA